MRSDLPPGTATVQQASTDTRQRRLHVPKITLTRVTPTGRVDIVATMALVAFLATFFISFTPFIAIVQYEKTLKAQCIIMPGARFVLFTLVISSGGITAICTPLVCVIFSRDFRQAFRRTCSRVKQCMSP